MLYCVFQETDLVKMTDKESPQELSQVGNKPAMNYI